jgi:hypothetical protein
MEISPVDSSERVNRFAVRYVSSITLVHLSLLVYGIFNHGPGWDEVGHLPAGISHWRTGRFDLYRVNPPLVRMVATAPLVFLDDGVKWQWNSAYRCDRPEWDLGKEMIETNGRGYFRFLRIARLMCLPFAALAIWVIWKWTRELFGTGGAMLSTSVWCFSPIVLTNAQMLTPDTAATACGALACFVFRQWLFKGTLRWAFIAGLAMGLAELTKFTWLILFGVWPLHWMFHRWIIPNRRALAIDTGHLLVIFATCLFVINLGYGFEGTCQRLGDYRFFSTTLGGTRVVGTNQWIEGNHFKGTAFAPIPVPLPLNMVQGIDRQKLDFESDFTSYLRGEWRKKGWWYYYLYGLVVKEPLGFLLLLGCAIVTAFRLKRDAQGIAEAACLVFPGLMLFVFVSSQTGFSHHLRYVLPTLIFLAIAVGICGAGLHSKLLTQRLAWTFVAIGAVSSLLAFPHSHAYFSELVGGPKNGPLHLLNSNIDWGQDILLLEKWAIENPEKPLDGILHSLPFWLGVKELTTLPKSDVPTFFAKPFTQGTTQMDNLQWPVPGRYAVSVGHIYEADSGYEYLRAMKPVDQVGHTIFIYELSLTDVARMKRDTQRIQSKSPGTL